MTTLDGLQPVRYNYRNSRDEEYVGFIAEDVPELVAMNNRKGLSAMDIAAVLTKVAQEQKAELAKLKAEKDTEVAALRAENAKQKERLSRMESDVKMLLTEMKRANQVAGR